MIITAIALFFAAPSTAAAAPEEPTLEGMTIAYTMTAVTLAAQQLHCRSSISATRRDVFETLVEKLGAGEALAHMDEFDRDLQRMGFTFGPLSKPPLVSRPCDPKRVEELVADTKRLKLKFLNTR